ncbi:MAG TPA: alpha-1,4-glucan--maltose-1-phosphate maltosyltransferase [Solirubrobacteraceae bacterium]|nr:alpha-1,4-glucan--maltose-1-phosphate maltosyltransferase [Solirubrobacteraceae bacterium]
MPAATRTQAPARIHIQYPQPTVDAGRYPAKRTVGDVVEVSADVFRDGHDKLRAVVRARGPGADEWIESELHPVDAHHNGVRWAGAFTVDRLGRWEWTVQAWTDLFATWRDELRRKIEAGQHDLSGELSEGVVLLDAVAGRADDAGDRRIVEHALEILRDPELPEGAKHDAAMGQELFAAVERNAERYGVATLEPAVALEVDRVRARFGSWYELFPRSFGGLKGVREQLPRLAELGFDVLYLPPIHPIGKTNRKGRNNTLVAGENDPGSPWAIGDESGGHDAVHRELGTHDDVRALCAAAAENGIDIALDLAIQTSPDHPWLKEHPEWFLQRPDGTLKYAENPPKKYQDIYNLNWDTPHWRELWEELRRVTLLWVEHGVKAFRVDNPHTKPIAFWEWLIAEVHKVDRDIIFFAEAFTRRAMMRQLAKIGFTQGYTYFTWKNTGYDLIEYVTELAHGPEREYFRPNFFTNTPDILNEYLVHGGPAAFYTRYVLAATLSPSYGIYSGYEHYENVPVRPGSEEYLDSEKFEAKQRRLDGPMLNFIARMNQVRRENPALQYLSNVRWLDTYNEQILAYVKQHGSNTVICAVNLDPHNPQEGSIVVPPQVGLPGAFQVRDLFSGEAFGWWTGSNYVRLDPWTRQAHVLHVETR